MTEPTDIPDDATSSDDEKLADKPKLSKHARNTRLVTAAATGIGSAALLYANRSRKPKKPESE